MFAQGIKASLITGSHQSSSHIIHSFVFIPLFFSLKLIITQNSTSEKMVNDTTLFPGPHAKCCGIQQGEIPVGLHQERLELSCHPYTLLWFTIKPRLLMPNPVSTRNSLGTATVQTKYTENMQRARSVPTNKVASI